MSAPVDSRNPRAKPAGPSQRSRVSLVETPTYSTTHFPEARSLQNSKYAQSANDSDQPVLQARKRQRRWSPEGDLPATLPSAFTAQQMSSTAQQQLAASQSYSEGSQTRPERTLNISSASPHKSTLPQGTLVAGTAQPQQAGHTYSSQISMGPHLPNNLQSQGAIVTAQGTTPEQLQAWRAAGRPECIKCGKCHPPPCSAEKVAESLARAAEKKLIAEQNAARHAPAQQRPPTHRAQIIPPPVWGGPPGTNVWSDTTGWSTPWAPSAPWTPLAAPATIPAVPAQAAAQLDWYAQPREWSPVRPTMSTSQRQSWVRSLYHQYFTSLSQEDKLRFTMAVYQDRVDQLPWSGRERSASQQHSPTDAAAPGSGSQTRQLHIRDASMPSLEEVLDLAEKRRPWGQ
jgi:hypothetical protein